MSLWQRLKSSLSKTAESVSTGVKVAVGLTGKLDAKTREALEETLLQADVGMAAATEILDTLKRRGVPEPLTEEGLKEALAAVIAEKLAPLAGDFDLTNPDILLKGSAPNDTIKMGKQPIVILVAGVNGGGKTTSIGKLCALWRSEKKKVVVAAADTFRAGAVDQLAVWAERAKVPLVRPEKEGADPGGVAYRAVEQGQADGADIVLIDTAGRLPNRADLMAELGKIRRVVQKLDADAPHHTLLVLDGTQGQAVLRQVQEFAAQGGVDGLVVTKLDGSAKAGFLLALAHSGVTTPVVYVGVGEGMEDIQRFDAVAFARGLVGLAG